MNILLINFSYHKDASTSPSSLETMLAFSLMPVVAWKDLQSSVNIIKVEMERPALSSAH